MVVVIGDEQQNVGPYEAGETDADTGPSRTDPPHEAPSDGDDGAEDEAGYGHGV